MYVRMRGGGGGRFVVGGDRCGVRVGVCVCGGGG